MDEAYSATCVAFVHTTGGRLRVLLCVDRGGEPLFDGDPALLAEHRPGDPADTLHLEGPDAVPVAGIARVERELAGSLAALLDAAFDDAGEFRRERLLGRVLPFRAPAWVFDAAGDWPRPGGG